MLRWLRRRWLPAPSPREISVVPSRVRSGGREMTGQYLKLHTYLNTRFADTVVLTFAQIEDVVGFALPAQARLERAWWTAASVSVAPHHSDSWSLAGRTAAPNLAAKIVSFARVF